MNIPMRRAQKTRFLVHVADWTEIPAHNLEVRVLANVVARHLEHPEVQIRDWAERATSDEDDRLFVRIPHLGEQPLPREGVVSWWAGHRGWALSSKVSWAGSSLPRTCNDVVGSKVEGEAQRRGVWLYALRWNAVCNLSPPNFCDTGTHLTQCPPIREALLTMTATRPIR